MAYSTATSPLGTVCSGGQGVTTYSYAVSNFQQGYNIWSNKVETTLPDYNFADATDPRNLRKTTYYNFAGQVMLEVQKQVATGNMWYSFTEYDNNGNAILRAGTDAVSGFSEQYADLLHKVNGNYEFLRDTSGLIELTDYYTTTTATQNTAGGVAGYESAEKIAQGETGTRILQSSRDYIAKTVGADTIYFVASSSVYATLDGTNPQTTTYSYTWHSGTAAVLSRTTTGPVIGTGQNGSGVANSSTTIQDTQGRTIWTRDAAGYLTYTAYDGLTGAVLKTITDVDTTRTSEFDSSLLPTGWATPTGGGLHLVSTMDIDTLGRTVKATDPNGNVTFTVYNDAAQEVRTYRGWHYDASLGAYTTTGPIEISRQDLAGGYSESLTIAVQPHVTANRPDGTEAIANIQSLSRSYTSAGGQMIASDTYFNLSGVTYSAQADLGVEGVNYLRTRYSYDKRGRLDRVQSPDGTIQRTTYDVLGRSIGTYIGTSDTHTGLSWTPDTNTGSMVLVSSTVYDNGGVGTGLMTSSSSHAGESTAYTTQYQYDFRHRMTASRSPDGIVTAYTLDNLGRATVVDTYADVNGNFTLDTGELRGRVESLYDDQGRVYQSSTYQVDPVTGTAGNRLTSRTWFDARGQVAKTLDPSGLMSKMRYDGAGRSTHTFLSQDSDETTYAQALDVSDDVVFEQSQMFYDAGSRNVASVSFKRYGDDSTTLGELDGSTSYRQAAVTWYDHGDRAIASANFGRDNGSTPYVFDALGALLDANLDGIPDEAQSAPRTPNSSDDYLVTAMQYDAAGRQHRTIDNAGRIHHTEFDLLGRTVKSIENYVDGIASESETASDRTTEFLYDAQGRLVTQRAYNPQGTGQGVQLQDTRFLHESATHGSWVTSTIYPDSADTSSAGSDQVKQTYDRLGRVISTTDQRGVTHEYAFDSAGRLQSDSVTSLGTSGLVDGHVLRVERTYDDMGRAKTLTSYDAASGGNIVNQVAWTYDGYGNIVQTQQSHDGAVTASTPKVIYTYEDGSIAGEARYVRLAAITYPDGRVLRYNYDDAGVAAVLNRVDNLADDAAGTTKYLQYAYLGAGTVTRVSHPASAAGETLNYDPDNDHSFAGWDRFGRVISQRWTDGSGTTVLDHYQYTYDRAGNRTSRVNVLHTALSETYSYDGLDRLTQTQRAGSNYQAWNLDSQGNWSSFDNQGATQTRTTNAANEITNLTTGTPPSYDAAGNSLTTPTPGTAAPGSSGQLHLKYDAWNRLVEVRADDGTGQPGDVIAAYEYDGRSYRVLASHDREGVESLTHFYYNDAWQLLEVQDAAGQTTEQTVYDLRYIDAAVVQFRDTNSDGTLDQTLTFLHDGNYNVTAVLDAGTGSILERYSYDAYGQHTVHDAAWSLIGTTSTIGNHLLYAGYQFDSDTGLHLARNRYYHSSLGTWLTRDPLGYVDGMNVYQYVGGNAVNASDPSGLLRYTATKEQTKTKAGYWTFDFEVFRQLEGDKNNKTLRIGLRNSEIRFTPTTGCPTCKSIRIIQAVQVRKTLRPIGDRDWEHDGERFDNDQKGILDNFYFKGGWHIDALPKVLEAKGKAGSPYYNDFNTDGQDGSTNGYNHASIYDGPNTNYMNLFRQMFETCAVCADEGKNNLVLSCIRWGYKADTRNPVLTPNWTEKLVALQPVEVSDKASDNWTGALEKYVGYYEAKNKNHK